MNIDVPYGITKRIAGVQLAEARARVVAALQAEGFGVLTEIDVQKTLEAKLGERIDPYLILGACNPKLAHRAIRSEPGIGLLLPCNVVLTQDGSDVVVSAASPQAMFAAVEPNPELADVAREAEEILRRAVSSL
ncbi:MAG: DUF302 domain-containing protein [Myxococcota bacterium]|nr:DUF302 domain-containing protein [Myxococcota bacterium]